MNAIYIPRHLCGYGLLDGPSPADLLVRPWPTYLQAMRKPNLTAILQHHVSLHRNPT